MLLISLPCCAFHVPEVNVMSPAEMVRKVESKEHGVHYTFRRLTAHTPPLTLAFKSAKKEEPRSPAQELLLTLRKLGGSITLT
jgi:hypothetical protein